jgi:Transposase DDE domain
LGGQWLQTQRLGSGADHGIEVEVVSKDPYQKGFRPLPKRWAVERTLGWLVLHRRLARDYETLPERSRTMLHWSMIDNMFRALIGESTPSWRVELSQPDIKT